MFICQFVLLILVVNIFPFYIHLTREYKFDSEVSLQELQNEKNKSQWKAGTYRDITIRRSTIVDVFQKWRKPKSSGHWEWDNEINPKYLFYDYEVPEGFMGKIRVEAETRTGKVTSIDISPSNMSTNQAIELFGKDYVYTRYKFCTCNNNEPENPIYESTDGNLIYLEYRNRGITMIVDKGQIMSIQFVDKPIGLNSAEDCKKDLHCNPKIQKTKRKKKV